MIKKIHYLITASLIIFYFSNSYSAGASPSLLGRLSEAYPQTLKGMDQMPDDSTIKILRKKYLASTDYYRSVALAYLNKLQPLLIETHSKFVDSLRAQLETVPTEGARILSLLPDLVSITRLTYAASSVSAPSDEGVSSLLRSITLQLPMEHIFGADKVVDGIPAWYLEDQTLKSIDEDSKTSASSSVASGEGYWYLKDRARKELRKNLRFGDHVAVFAVGGKVGLSLMVDRLIKNVHIIALPLETYEAHSLKMSPRDFAAHDLSHFYILKQQKSVLKNWSARLAYALMEKTDVGYLKATKIAGTLGRLKFQNFQRLIQNIFDKNIQYFLTAMESDGEDKALKAQAKKDYNKLLICFFEILHEESGLTFDVLNADSPSEVVRAFFKKILEDDGLVTDSSRSTESRDAGAAAGSGEGTVTGSSEALVEKSSCDPLNTDPLTGRLLSGGAVTLENPEVEATIKALDLPVNVRLLSADKKVLGDLWDELDIQIEDSPLQVLVKAISRKDGESINLKLIKSRLLFGDAIDRNSLLKLVGQGVTVPVVSEILDPVAKRESVFDFRRAVTSQLEGVAREVLGRILGTLTFEGEGTPSRRSVYDELWESVGDLAPELQGKIRGYRYDQTKLTSQILDTF